MLDNIREVFNEAFEGVPLHVVVGEIIGVVSLFVMGYIGCVILFAVM